MYQCESCERKLSFFSVDGDTRCKKHGLTGFHTIPLDGLDCSACAKKAQRCQTCGCYVNAREYEKRLVEKRNY